jgi:hypothetical protein
MILTLVTMVGVVAMLAPGLVWADFTAPEGMPEIEAVGQCGRGPTGFLARSARGTTSAGVTPLNPFGVDPTDPKDRTTCWSNPPTSRSTSRSRCCCSKDAAQLHRARVPREDGSRAGMITYWPTPTKTGKYDVLCFMASRTRCGAWSSTMPTYRAWHGPSQPSPRPRAPQATRRPDRHCLARARVMARKGRQRR